MAPQVTHVVKTKSVVLTDGCPFCDIILALPLSAANWSMVVGDSRQHHSLVCGCKRSHSESEDGVSEDQGEWERIFILDEADEPVSPPGRDGRTAPRPSPTPVLDPPPEGAMV